MDDARSKLPTPKTTEEKPEVIVVDPKQQSFNFGSTAEDFRSDAEVQKDLLTKIFNTLFDISKNVSLMTQGFPDLLEASKSVDKLKDTNTLAEQETKREDLAKNLRQKTADVVNNTANSIFGLFEKIFAVLTPFLLGFLLSFTDLTDPLQLLKDALLGLAAFMAGRFIYQLVKSLSLSLVSSLLERFVRGPKVINAPNSIINTGGIGGTGTGVGTGGGGFNPREGVVSRRGRPVSAATQARFARRFGAEAAAAKFAPVSRGGGALNTVMSVMGLEAMTTGGIAGGTGVPAPSGAGAAGGARAAGALSKMKGLLPIAGKLPLIGAALTVLASPFQYMSKREEGKSKFRAGTETAASITGVLGGAAAGAALGTAIGGPIGTAIGGIIGGIAGEKVVSSFTEGLFNFFTGNKPEDFKPMSVFSEEYANLSREEQSKIKISDSERETFRKVFRVESLQDFSTEDLIRAQNDIRRAREKDPAKENQQNFIVSKGGDVTNNKHISVPALEAEISRRGLPSGGLGAK